MAQKELCSTDWLYVDVLIIVLRSATHLYTFRLQPHNENAVGYLLAATSIVTFYKHFCCCAALLPVLLNSDLAQHLGCKE
jgi:hypothetical protein